MLESQQSHRLPIIYNKKKQNQKQKSAQSLSRPLIKACRIVKNFKTHKRLVNINIIFCKTHFFKNLGTICHLGLAFLLIQSKYTY